ncbi:hypothetical protein MRX96_047361 [Rhipicephalus microplus]
MVHTEINDPNADRTKVSLGPKSRGLSSILVTQPPIAGAPFMNVNKENHSTSAQHESSTSSSSPTVHSECKSPEPGSTERSSMSTSSPSFGQSGVSAERAALREQAPKARALRVRGLGGGDPGECPHLLSPVKVLPEHPSSTTYSSLMVHKETRDAEAGSTKFSSVPKSQGLPRGLAVRPPIARAPSKDANTESISGSAQHHSSTNYSSLMVYKETKSTEVGTTKFLSVPKSQGLPSGLVVRPPTARAPCEDVNKENSSVSAQKQLSADYSSVGKHTETKDSEADRTWFSSVPKGQGLPSGLVVRPPTGRAPFKYVSKENSSVLAQKQSSADSSSPMVHTETNDPKADRTKISLRPESRGLSSILVTPAPTAGAPFMNANKENHSASAQHESHTSKSSPTVHSERKSPEPGSKECSSMSTSSASFGQRGVSAERAALREQARKARALRVRGLGGGDPGECPHLLSPVKVLPGQEDELARRVQDALGDVNVALWLFANHRDHLYGLAGNKVAQQSRAPPPILEEQKVAVAIGAARCLRSDTIVIARAAAVAMSAVVAAHIQLASPAHAINSRALLTAPAQATSYAITEVTTLKMITRGSSSYTLLNHIWSASTSHRLLTRPPRQAARTAGTRPSLCRAHGSNPTSSGAAPLSKVKTTPV